MLDKLGKIDFKMSYGTSIENILQKVKFFLSQHIKCIDDLHYLVEFYKKYSDKFTETDLQEIHKLFQENCEKIVDNILDNTNYSSEEIHIKTKYLQSFSEIFHIEENIIEKYIESLDEVYYETLRNEESYAEANYDSWKENQREAEYNQHMEEQLIDSMFNSLKE